MDDTADVKEGRGETVTKGRCEVKRFEGTILRSTAGTDEWELIAALAELIEEEDRSETECDMCDSIGRETKLTEGTAARSGAMPTDLVPFQVPRGIRRACC